MKRNDMAVHAALWAHKFGVERSVKKMDLGTNLDQGT